ncbi:MAG: tetratricopeptide repeat protein [Thermodesulfobacteriota bacterium]
MRLVFRDYVILLAAPRLTQSVYKEMLKTLNFGRIESTHEDQQVISLMKKLKPQLVAATMSLSVFSGPQLLSAARSDPETENVPFLIIGVKEDLKPGGMADQVNKAKLARFAGLPLEQEHFQRIVLELLDPLIDPRQEQAYALFDLAKEMAAAGDAAGAIEAYRRGLESYDANLDSWLGLATVHTDLEQYDEAEKDYFQALAINQYSFLAYLGLAELYERRQDYELTIGILKQALSIAQRLKVSSKSVARINFFIGEFELRLKRLTSAEKAFDQAIEKAPDDAVLRSDIGDAYANKGYYPESEKHYLAALEIDPNLAHVFNRLGIAYRKQAKYQKALQLYDKARLHHPRDEHLLFNIARAHYEDIHHSKAMSFLEEALTLAPAFRQAKSMIARLKADFKKTELDLWDETQTGTIEEAGPPESETE